MILRTLKIACVAAVVATTLIGRPSVAREGPPPATSSASRPAHSAVIPVARTDDYSKQRHERFNRRVKDGDIGLIFLGDSITEGWEGAGREVWRKYYGDRKAVNLGIGGDRTQHVLWRLDHGNLAGLDRPVRPGAATPKLVVLMIGTNNSNGNDNTAEEIADGIVAIVEKLREKLPQTKVLLLAIFPRGEKPDDQRRKNADASRLAASRVTDGKNVVYLDIGRNFLQADGTLTKDIMPDLLHLSPQGYEIWAGAIESKVQQLMQEKPAGR